MKCVYLSLTFSTVHYNFFIWIFFFESDNQTKPSIFKIHFFTHSLNIYKNDMRFLYFRL